MTNWRNIIGHDWAVEILSSAIKYDRVGHAWLITGPDRVGKTTLALTFAQALNCTAQDRPCGTCRNCTLIEAGRHPDVRVVEPAISARGKAQIKIDTMRDLQRSLQLAAMEGRYKIAIITRFDAANLNAANAFLKTLEEPPSNTILILTATEADALLDTIKSRCRVVGIRPIPAPTIHQALVTRKNTPQETAKLLAHLSNGRIGEAFAMADDESLLAARSDKLDLLNTVLVGSLVNRFKMADALARKPEALNDLLNTWLTWWRDLLMVSQGRNESALINFDEFGRFQTLTHSWNEDSILHATRRTKETLWQLDRNVNLRLALEALFLNYPQATVLNT